MLKSEHQKRANIKKCKNKTERLKRLCEKKTLFKTISIKEKQQKLSNREYSGSLR